MLSSSSRVNSHGYTIRPLGQTENRGSGLHRGLQLLKPKYLVECKRTQQGLFLNLHPRRL
uniref:Uncharacterized protein n=1 Tax=Anguilla anguilla TaxID=7936 RepID=A0A0E9TWQ3_ANGAN